MHSDKRMRGRPKGTGLNDFAHLKAIAGLMSTDPNLRPTTAIRQLGIQDPSVIRRLRDKFHACESELMAELRAAAKESLSSLRSGEPAPAQCEPVQRVPARAMALTAPDNERISQPLSSFARKAAEPAPAAEAAKPEAEAISQPAPRRQRPPRDVALPSETKLPEWMGVGISVYSMSMEAHFAVVGTLFEWPPLAAALRTQVAFAELALATIRPGFLCLETASALKT